MSILWTLFVFIITYLLVGTIIYSVFVGMNWIIDPTSKGEINIDDSFGDITWFILVLLWPVILIGSIMIVVATVLKGLVKKIAVFIYSFYKKFDRDKDKNEIKIETNKLL